MTMLLDKKRWVIDNLQNPDEATLDFDIRYEDSRKD
jgi:hypothetical protein